MFKGLPHISMLFITFNKYYVHVYGVVYSTGDVLLLDCDVIVYFDISVHINVKCS